MSTETDAALRAAAEVATPGPWRTWNDGHVGCPEGGWIGGIFQPTKLREQYDTLRLQAQRKSGGTSRNEEWRAMQDRQMARAVEREREMGLR